MNLSGFPRKPSTDRKSKWCARGKFQAEKLKCRAGQIDLVKQAAPEMVGDAWFRVGSREAKRRTASWGFPYLAHPNPADGRNWAPVDRSVAGCVLCPVLFFQSWRGFP